jgi:hypothetical protein
MVNPLKMEEQYIEMIFLSKISQNTLSLGAG